jgi:hypothetical protein
LDPAVELDGIRKNWPTLDHEKLLDSLKKLAIKFGEDPSEVEFKAEISPKLQSVSDGKSTKWFETKNEGFIDINDWVPDGIKLSLNFHSSGREISLVINNKREILKRVYIDDGKFHMAEVKSFLRSWPKAIKQKYLGGSPRGMRKKTIAHYKEVMQKYIELSHMSDKTFCEWWNKRTKSLDEKLSPRKLYTIKKFMNMESE